MAERRGHPVAAVGVVVATLWAAALLGFGGAMAWSGLGGFTPKTNPGLGVPLVVLAVLALVGGLWSARRVGSGFWGRRRFLPPPPPPSLFDEPPPPPA